MNSFWCEFLSDRRSSGLDDVVADESLYSSSAGCIGLLWRRRRSIIIFTTAETTTAYEREQYLHAMLRVHVHGWVVVVDFLRVRCRFWDSSPTELNQKRFVDFYA